MLLTEDTARAEGMLAIEVLPDDNALLGMLLTEVILRPDGVLAAEVVLDDNTLVIKVLLMEG